MSATGPKVLQDPDLDTELRQHGVVVMPLLDAHAVDQLAHLQCTHAAAADRGMVLDFTRIDREAVQRVQEDLVPFWHTWLPQVFRDHEIVVTSFVTKHPGDDSAMLLHHEPTFVEQEGTTFNVWIPLVDVGPDLDNGGLEVVPRSEHIPVGPNGYHTPLVVRPYEHYLRPLLRPLAVPAGYAVVYDTRVLHASPPNRSGAPRPALAATVAPRGARLVHVVATGRRGRQLFGVDRAFFTHHHPADLAGGMPAGYPVLRQFAAEPELSGPQLAAALGRSDAPVPHAVLPPDLARDGVAPPPLPHKVLEDLQPADDDVRLVAHDLGTPTLQGIAPIAGRVGAGPPASLPAAARATLAPLLDRLPNAPDHLVVLDPGARAELSVAGSLVVLECPAVRSGIVGTAGALAGSPGQALESTQSTPLVVWNDGPGPLVLGLSRPRRRGRRRWPMGSRLRSAR